MAGAKHTFLSRRLTGSRQQGSGNRGTTCLSSFSTISAILEPALWWDLRTVDIKTVSLYHREQLGALPGSCRSLFYAHLVINVARDKKLMKNKWELQDGEVTIYWFGDFGPVIYGSPKYSKPTIRKEKQNFVALLCVLQGLNDLCISIICNIIVCCNYIITIILQNTVMHTIGITHNVL